jgi:hypothetical protein
VDVRRTVVAFLMIASPALAQTTSDPFPDPIFPRTATAPVVTAGFTEFATIPDSEGVAPRMMTLVDEPATRRLFINDMTGPIFSVSYDGGTVTPYLDIDDPRWGMDVQSSGRERGFQSFAFHPQFGQRGAPGYGKFYTWADVSDTTPAPDFTPTGEGDSHDTVLLEWSAADASAATYDGLRPRVLFRVQQPYGNHNAGHLAFDPTAAPADPDFGMLYVGVADGGSGGDPQNMAQNHASVFGKILRIDPLGTNAPNGRYGIPADNPFTTGGPPGARPEIWALGLRNPQRFGWDPANGNM